MKLIRGLDFTIVLMFNYRQRKGSDSFPKTSSVWIRTVIPRLSREVRAMERGGPYCSQMAK